MEWLLFTLGMIDAIAGSVLFLDEGLVRFIGIVLLGKGIVTILKSFS